MNNNNDDDDNNNNNNNNNINNNNNNNNLGNVYSNTLTRVQLGEEGRLHLLFLKIEKSVLILERKALIVSNFGLNFPFKM